MTEFSGQAGRMSNNEPADESSLEYPSDDDTTADEAGTSGVDAPLEGQSGADGAGATD